MKRIFTKSFFERSVLDQAAVIDAEISALQKSAAACADEAGRRKLSATARRIEQKAIKLGIYGEMQDRRTVPSHGRGRLRQLMLPFAEQVNEQKQCGEQPGELYDQAN